MRRVSLVHYSAPVMVLGAHRKWQWVMAVAAWFSLYAGFLPGLLCRKIIQE